MVVADFHAVGVPVVPVETHALLVVDAYAPLVRAVAFQGFKAIVGRNAQILDSPRVVQHPQFTASNLLNLIGEASRKFSLPDLAGFFVVEVRDHGCQYHRLTKVLSTLSGGREFVVPVSR